MALPAPTQTSIPPEARDEFAGLEELDRPELDEDAPFFLEEAPTTPTLPTLGWDDDDDESGVKRRA